MTPFFRGASRLIALENIADSWVGTPFALGVAVRGAGVDCVRFSAEVLRECGHMGPYEFPPYSIDGGDYLPESLVQLWMGGNPLFEPLDRLDYLMPGDVLEFRIGRGVSHHVGLYSGAPPQSIWSAMTSDGVRRRTLRDATWGRRLVAAWRPVDSGFSFL